MQGDKISDFRRSAEGQGAEGAPFRFRDIKALDVRTTNDLPSRAVQESVTPTRNTLPAGVDVDIYILCLPIANARAPREYAMRQLPIWCSILSLSRAW